MKFIKIIIVGLLLIGLGVSAYLTYLHYRQVPAVCGTGSVFSNCESVLHSKYSEIYGIPMALLGVVFYVATLILSGLILFRNKRVFIELLFWLELTGVIFSTGLTYLQFFVLRAVCPYCLTSAIVTFLVFGLSWLLKVKNIKL